MTRFYTDGWGAYHRHLALDHPVNGKRRTQPLERKHLTLRMQDRTRREALYGEFIREASKLFADAFEHELDDPAKLVQLYAIVSTLRLFGQPQTIKEAERVMNQIGATYFAPNKELRQFAEITPGGELDPLFAFSNVCREELKLV